MQDHWALYLIISVCLYSTVLIYLFAVESNYGHPEQAHLTEKFSRFPGACFLKAQIYKCPEPFLLRPLTPLYHSPRFFHSNP